MVQGREKKEPDGPASVCETRYSISSVLIFALRSLVGVEKKKKSVQQGKCSRPAYLPSDRRRCFV